MIRSRSLCIAAILLLFAGFAALPAHAVNKDMVQLQTQVQQLQDAVANLQKSNDENMGMLKELVQQTADAVNNMTATVNGLKLSMKNQQDAIGTSNQQLSGQVQSLNDSLDELKARMVRMEKSLGVIQSQQQTANAALSNLPQAAASGASGTTTSGGGTSSAVPAGASPNTDASSAPTDSNPNGALPPNAEPIPAGTEPVAVPAPAAPAVPAAGVMYRGAYADYISARYTLASSEFSDLIKDHPDDNLSGNAYFYLGEMDMRLKKPSAAIKDFDQVLERYPDNAKIPAAHLHKAYALIDTRQTTAGERELRALIQRFPNSPESSQARAKLSTLRARE